MKLPPGHVPGLSVQHKATAYGGFGQKMLEKMGWEKGQGLGKEKHGMKSAIEVKKKEDTLGVGATTTGWKWDWKYWEDAYNTGLQSLSKGSKKKKRHSKTSGSSSDSDNASDSDDSTSTSTTTSSGSSDSGSDDSSSASDSDSEASSSDSDSDSESDEEHNARLAAAIGPVLNRDGTKASASKAEMKIAKQLAKVERGSAGRFGGRAGKMARIRQQEAEQAAAMAAKLGMPALPAVTAGSKGTAASSSSEDTAAAAAAAAADSNSSKKSKKRKQADSSGDDDASAAAAASKGAKKQKIKKCAQSEQNGSEQQEQQDGQAPVSKKQRVIVVVDIKGPSTAESFKQFKPTPSTGWWGATMFASAGLLEGLEQEQEQRKRTTFDEDMQAKVYMAAHDAQRQGKRGLGKRAIKIAGGNWEGKKVTFDDEAPAGQNEQQAALQPADDSAAENATASKPNKKSKSSSKAQESASSKEEQSSSRLNKKVKWTKLAVVQLKDCAGGVLKWKKLWPLLKAAAEQQGAEVPEDSKDRAWQKLQACSEIQINGKSVCLAA